jgi:hypothetical protein
MRGAKA